MLAQYAMPINTVSTDAQRNHHSARDIRLGRIFPFVAGSSPFMKGTLTRLKKYSRPSQVTPPTKCNQRNSIRRLVWKSEGKLMSIKFRTPILKRYSENDDCRWRAREMKPRSISDSVLNSSPRRARRYESLRVPSWSFVSFVVD